MLILIGQEREFNGSAGDQEEGRNEHRNKVGSEALAVDRGRHEQSAKAYKRNDVVEFHFHGITL